MGHSAELGSSGLSTQLREASRRDPSQRKVIGAGEMELQQRVGDVPAREPGAFFARTAERVDHAEEVEAPHLAVVETVGRACVIVATQHELQVGDAPLAAVPPR